MASWERLWLMAGSAAAAVGRLGVRQQADRRGVVNAQQTTLEELPTDADTSTRRAPIIWSMDDDEEDNDIPFASDVAGLGSDRHNMQTLGLSTQNIEFESIEDLVDSEVVRVVLADPDTKTPGDSAEADSAGQLSDRELTRELERLEEGERGLQVEDVVRSALDMKGDDIFVLEVGGRRREDYDFLVIVSARSKRHLRALAQDAALRHREAAGLGSNTPLSSLIIGHADDYWSIVATGRVMYHMMLPEARSYYQLESLWQGLEDGEEDMPPTSRTGPTAGRNSTHQRPLFI
ncbi:uncharacterized protein MONBRDRAFT_33976 [Monosiga brevicollis MX1]|uniref:Ribosomal silencing factor RsfS n=1 Tax=Monosiga brevicollis TaxID=81824 RepID=A9V8V9_MONBE|nr:uncharacterized protein MONBRDRAFT_33976 [Monosiga brevicollis MX1]EDQ86027.1 predicted protein [Monosiga brevicollis MX1]|eukprot:XP_001749221.1 hypothetical protein [Monosiga brevicollis MX1]